MPELKVTAFCAPEGVHRRGHADLPLGSLRFFSPSQVLFASKRRDPGAAPLILQANSASGIPKRW